MQNALVTGASRGVGKGVATALSACGFRVFATGRSIAEASLPEAIIRIPCDHTKVDQTDRVFEILSQESAALSVLVNCAWGGYEKMVEDGKFTWNASFWEQPDHRWNNMIETGVRSAFWCSARAAKMMVPVRDGLIVNISFWAAQKYVGNTIYGVSKAATDKMTADMAHELRDYNITVVSLYPGLVRTESVLAASEAGFLNLANSESPEFVGHVIAKLAGDTNRVSRSGDVLVAAALAAEYGLADIDGQYPLPLTLESV